MQGSMELPNQAPQGLRDVIDGIGGYVWTITTDVLLTELPCRVVKQALQTLSLQNFRSFRKAQIFHQASISLVGVATFRKFRTTLH